MADRKSKKWKPSRCLGRLGGDEPRPRGDPHPQAAAGRTWLPTTASPSASVNVASTASRASSTSGPSASVAASVVVASAITAPPAGRPATGRPCPPGRCAAAGGRCPRAGPRAGAGSPGMYTSTGHDLVDALGDRVAVPVGAAAVGARAHRDDVLGVGHLLVEALDGRDHLVGHRAGDDHHVGLAGAGRQGDDAEAHHVVAGRGEGGAHLDGAAGEAPLVGPEAVLAGRVEQRGQRLGQLAALDEAHQTVVLLEHQIQRRTFFFQA